MTGFIVHWLRRIFRGSVVNTLTHSRGGVIGRLVQYRSGYIEYIDDNGRTVDVAYDLWLQENGPRDWICYPFGGGGQIVYKGVTRAEAMRRTAKELGAVSYVDDDHGFIFYRDGRPVIGSQPV